MTSFLITWFSNLHFLWNLPKAIALQSFSAVECLGQVLQRDYKNTMMTSLWRHFMILDSKFPYFIKLVISYQPAKFQMPQLSASNFTEVFIRHPKNALWRHYDVTSQCLTFKIAYSVEFNRGYQPGKFHWPRLSGSSFTRADGKHFPPQLTLSQKAQSL